MHQNTVLLLLIVYMCFFSQNTVIGVPGKVLERFFIKNSKIVSFEKERIFLFSSSLSADTAHIYPSLGAKTPQTRSKSGFAGFFNFFLIGGKLTLSHFPMARPYLRGTSHARRKSTQCPEASERRVSF